MNCFWICSAILLSKLQFTASSSPLNETEPSSLSYLKSTLATTSCQFSIGLFSKGFGGWSGDTATVKINNSNVLTNVTLDSGSIGPALHNFTVPYSVPIAVIYNPNPNNQFKNRTSYAVYSGASGTGSVIYNSLLFFVTIANTCTSSCYYGLLYKFNNQIRTENTLSLFLNRVAVFQAVSLSSTEYEKILNFEVVQGDVIQVLLYFPYSGGGFNYVYDVREYFSGGSYVSIYDWRANAIPSNGPSTLATIPNICGQTLSLTINAPSIVTSNKIPLSVVLSFPPSDPIQVNITLYCGTNSSTQTRLSSSNSSDPIDFPIPNSFNGSCYLVTQSIMMWGPVYANSTSFGIVVISQPQPLTFTSPSNNSSITIPSAINVTLVTATAPSISADVQVQFNCTSSSTSTQTFNVTTNLPYLFSNYSSNSYGPCTLSVINAPDYLILPSPVVFYLTYSLIITTPAPGETFAQGADIDLLVNSSPSNVGQALVTFTSATGSQTVSVTIGLLIKIRISTDLSGLTVLAVTGQFANPGFSRIFVTPRPSPTPTPRPLPPYIPCYNPCYNPYRPICTIPRPRRESCKIPRRRCRILESENCENPVLIEQAEAEAIVKIES